MDFQAMKRNLKCSTKTFVLSSAFVLSAFSWAGPVNINTADALTLATELKGIGEKRAEAIVAYREANGEFSALEDLENVKGVGKATLLANAENIQFK